MLFVCDIDMEQFVHDGCNHPFFCSRVLHGAGIALIGTHVLYNSVYECVGEYTNSCCCTVALFDAHACACGEYNGSIFVVVDDVPVGAVVDEFVDVGEHVVPPVP